MPTAPPRVCNRCKRPTGQGRCPCIKPWEGSTRSGTNNAAWKKLRAAKLRTNPICEHFGCIRPAEQVDHIKPRAEGGTDAWDNLRSLCVPHHQQKTSADAHRGKYRPR